MVVLVYRGIFAGVFQYRAGGVSTLPFIFVLILLVVSLAGLLYFYYQKKINVQKERTHILEKQFNAKSREVAENKFKLLQLNEKYDKLILALEKSRNIVIFCDSNFNIIWVNRGFCVLFGLELEVFLTSSVKKINDFFSSDFTTQLKYNIKNNFNDVIEVDAEAFDGRKHHFAFTTELLYAEDENVQELVLIGSDISANKSAFQELGKSEYKFRTIFEKANDAMFIMDKDKFIDCNPVTLEMFDTKREDIIGAAPDAYSPEYQDDGLLSKDKTKELIDLAYKGKPQKFEWKHTTHKGIPFYTEVSLTLIDYNNGKALLAVIRNINERKFKENIRTVQQDITEASLKDGSLEELFKSIHAALSRVMTIKNFYIALIDEESGLLSFPYFIDENDPKPQPRKSGNGLTEYAQRQKETVLLKYDEFDELLKNDSIEFIGSRSFYWLGSPLMMNDKVIGCVVAQSYDENLVYTEDDKEIFSFVSAQIAHGIYKKYSEQIMFESRQRLKEMNSNKDALFSIIGHDLKGPLYGLLGFSEMLATELDDLTREEVMEYSNNIFEISKDIHHLLENLLNWTRFQSDKMMFEPDTFDLNIEIRDTIKKLGGSARKKEIEVNYKGKGSIEIFADKYHIQTVLRNLISNAVKFTYPKGKVSIEVEKLDNYAKVIVTDNGKGIAPDQQPFIFDDNKLISSAGTENEQGTGLGLVICKDMIFKNKGKIEFESEVDKGSVFSFTVPLADQNIAN